LVRRDWLAVRDFVRRDEAVRTGFDTVDSALNDPSSINAVRMQSTGGSPSNIFSHVFPSSREANSWPLRVPM